MKSLLRSSKCIIRLVRVVGSIRAVAVPWQLGSRVCSGHVGCARVLDSALVTSEGGRTRGDRWPAALRRTYHMIMTFPIELTLETLS